MKTVLIVEDDKAITSALTYRLEAVGYKVVTAADAVYAMNEAVNSQPDVAVLDINLPGGNGLLVAERMMNTDKTARIPVIFITASKQASNRTRAGELSATAFLEKPFSSAQLIDAIEDATSKAMAA